MHVIDASLSSVTFLCPQVIMFKTFATYWYKLNQSIINAQQNLQTVRQAYLKIHTAAIAVTLK